MPKIHTCRSRRRSDLKRSDLQIFLVSPENVLSDGTPFTHVEPVWNFGDSRENVLDMYGNSRENLLGISAVVISFESDLLHPWIPYIPQTEEIWLEMITTAEISDKFSRESPYMWNTFSRKSPKIQTGFHVRKRSLRHSNEWPGKPAYLEIQIF